MGNTNFNVEKKEHYALISIEVEKLDGTVSPSLKSELVLVNADGIKSAILDMSKTRYCDSSGLSAILVGNRLCKNAGGTFVICGAQEPVMKLIRISQLDSILNITPTRSEAEDFIFMDEVDRDLNKEE